MERISALENGLRSEKGIGESTNRIVKQVWLRIPSPTKMKEYKNTSSKLQKDDKVMITVHWLDT